MNNTLLLLISLYTYLYNRVRIYIYMMDYKQKIKKVWSNLENRKMEKNQNVITTPQENKTTQDTTPQDKKTEFLKQYVTELKKQGLQNETTQENKTFDSSFNIKVSPYEIGLNSVDIDKIVLTINRDFINIVLSSVFGVSVENLQKHLITPLQDLKSYSVNLIHHKNVKRLLTDNRELVIKLLNKKD